MDSKELRGLYEAYNEVYAPQENIEEGLRSAVKRLLGGGKKETEAPKPESRGDQLRKKYNVGPEKSDTSAKRQILDRSRARAEKDEKDYGDKPFQKQVAQKSKAAHDRYLKAGYSKYGADDATGRGSKAAKRAAALNKEEFEIIVNALIEEGYDLSSYTWDEMYEVCLDEAEVMKHQQERDRIEGNKAREDDRIKKARSKYGKERRYFPPTKGSHGEIERRQAQKPPSKLRSGSLPESYDLYDIILSHLIAEGYADTNESALVIMANMSEEWRQSIVEVKMDPRGRPASGPMNVYKQSKPNNDPAFQAALKSVRDADAKKTPEQRKAELDAYKERQMNR